MISIVCASHVDDGGSREGWERAGCWRRLASKVTSDDSAATLSPSWRLNSSGQAATAQHALCTVLRGHLTAATHNDDIYTGDSAGDGAVAFVWRQLQTLASSGSFQVLQEK